MKRKVDIYSISRIGEMILGIVDDEVMVKEGWEGSKKEFMTIYLPISSKMVKLEKIKKNLIIKK